ncbi:MAG: hypothetical protein E7218_08555 [Anaerofustis stercorihominis]|nr:hypothetical protein [Anaerofustis stercorihominis]
MSIKDYFKGLYFKCCTDDRTIAFIPASHSDDRNETASLQVITDDMSVSLSIDEITFSGNPFGVLADGCEFSDEGIYVDISEGDMKIEGSLRFDCITPVKYDIMGPFCMVPFMQCRHSVHSMTHNINGYMNIGDIRYDFDNGVGYIEGDSGRSFPKRYIWSQCCFDGGSLMFAVADIPVLAFSFTGIIGNILLDGKEYRIATYLGARVKNIDDDTVVIGQGEYEFTAKLIKRREKPLAAPHHGKMSRVIYESASCSAYYRFSKKDKILLEFTSDRASFEFEYGK